MILVLVPMVFMFIGAVLSGGLLDPDTTLTLDKLRSVYRLARLPADHRSTLAISLMVAAAATLAGVLLAWLIARTDLPAKGLMETCVIAPLFLSPFVGSIAWLILGSPKAGLINAIAQSTFGASGPLINVATPAGIVAIMALYFVPYAYLTVVSSLRNIDPAMEEASYLNGAGVLRTALRITLPVVRPALLSAFFFIFVLAAGTFAIPAVLDRSSQVRFLAVDVFQASATYPIDYGKSAAIGTLLFWVSIVGVTGYRLASRAARRFVTVTARGYRIRLVRLRLWRAAAVGLVLAYLLFAIVLPYFALIYCGFHEVCIRVACSTRHGPTQNALAVSRSPEVVAAIENTLLVGVISPTACVALGVFLATRSAA